jgi:hypothetical protein
VASPIPERSSPPMFSRAISIIGLVSGDFSQMIIALSRALLLGSPRSSPRRSLITGYSSTSLAIAHFIIIFTDYNF